MMKHVVNLFFLFCTASLFGQITNSRGVAQPWSTDLEKSSIDLTEITVLLQRDGIPPIDKPHFLLKEVALETYFKLEPVIALEVDGTARAYPLSVLMWHEIVNDKIGDSYFSVTYCPLCNAAIVFNRMLQFEDREYLLDFGVSGMLRNSDMVMWDRQTESWWQQFLGEAIVGSLTGAQLEVMPSMVIALEDFYERFPDGQVLSMENGVDRQYGTNPYTNYDRSIDKPFAFEGEIDDRLSATERVVDICTENVCRVYPWETISRKKVIHDQVDGLDAVLFFEQGAVSVMGKSDIREARSIGSVTVFQAMQNGTLLQFKKTRKGFTDQHGSLWDLTGRCTDGDSKGQQLTPIPHSNHFAFAWFAFHPDSEVYKD